MLTEITERAISSDVLREALATGEFLTANQAAKLTGIPFSTFNYHLRLGHIPSVPNPSSRTSFVTRQDAERFARRLRAWRDQSEDFDWFTDDDDDDSDEEDGSVVSNKEESYGTPSHTADPVAASA